MKLATQIIKDIRNGQADALLTDIYVDESLLDTQKERYIAAIEKFISLYGDKEVEVFSAPGRSEVSGNHTAHQHGEVLATAINLDIIAITAPRDGVVKVLSDDYDLKAVALDDLEKKAEEEGTSEGLIRGTLARFKELGLHIGGFEAYMTSEVLLGSGLSSSAAFEVMIGTVLSGLYNDMTVSPVLIAQIGQYTENVYFGKPCGLMDQCASSVGALIHIDFKDNDHPVVEKVDVDFSSFHHSLCIVDVHASHADLTDDYAAIPTEMKEVAHFFGKEFLREVDEKEFFDHLADVRAAVKNDREILRAIHFFKENARVPQIVEALNNDNFDLFKKLIKESGNSSYKFLQNVYADFDYKHQAVSAGLALSEIVLGDHGVSRVHGGGFAGTIQAFVENDFVPEYKKEIEKLFGEGSCHVLKVRKLGGCKVVEE